MRMPKHLLPSATQHQQREIAKKSRHKQNTLPHIQPGIQDFIFKRMCKQCVYNAYTKWQQRRRTATVSKYVRVFGRSALFFFLSFFRGENIVQYCSTCKHFAKIHRFNTPRTTHNKRLGQYLATRPTIGSTTEFNLKSTVEIHCWCAFLFQFGRRVYSVRSGLRCCV